MSLCVLSSSDIRAGYYVAQVHTTMDEVYINQEADPYVLETDGTLDLAGLNLQPASIVINRLATTLTVNCKQQLRDWKSHIKTCRKRGLVDAQTSKTKRSFADIQQNVLRDSAAGSMGHPLQITGTPVAGACSSGLLISELMQELFEYSYTILPSGQALPSTRLVWRHIEVLSSSAVVTTVTPVITATTSCCDIELPATLEVSVV